jgi:hypothetical protein
MIPFGAWLPDKATIGAPHLRQAVNVISKAEDYEPVRALSLLSQELATRARGAVSFQDSQGVVHVYAGDEQTLNELVGDGSWTDVSRLSGGAYVTSATGRWRFTQFGDTAIATNYDDVMQAAAMTAGTPFAALAGSPPRARHVATFSDFLVYGNTEDDPAEIGWSGINDPTAHTVGVNQSDRQVFPDGGFVQGFAAFDVLLVFQQNKIRRMAYVGPPLIMQFDVLETQLGCLEPNSIVQHGRIVFFLADQGFHMIDDGASAKPIGDQKVNRWFFEDCNQQYLHRMSAAIDPDRKVVVWSYVSANSPSGEPDSQLFYNYTTGRWTLGRLANIELVFNSLALGYTLEDLDTLASSIDALEIPLDDPSFMGGMLRFGAFNADGAYGVFVGSALEATLETNDLELMSGRRAYVSGVRPITDADSITVTVAARERAMDAEAYTSAGTLEAHGMVSLECGGRYHRAKMVIAAGDEWTSAQGLEFEAQLDGEV